MWQHVHDARPQVVFVSVVVPAARRSERERAVRRRQRAVAAAMVRAGLHVRRHLGEDGPSLLCPHGGYVYTYRVLTMSPCHHVTMSPCHHVTMSM